MSIFSSCDPDFSIACIWPHMPIDLGFGPDDLGMDPQVGDEQYPTWGVDNEGMYNAPLGHAGILLIQGGTGLTRYFEWGRYGSRDGAVNSYGVPNADLDIDKWPTVASLHNISRSITRRSGKNTWMHGNFSHRCGGFAPAVAFSEAYQSTAGPYNFVYNSCISFAHRVNRAGGFSWFGPVPILDTAPWTEMETGIFTNYVNYFPDGDRFVESVWQID